MIRALLIVTGVKPTQVYGTGEFFSPEKQKEIERILGIEFVE